MYLPIESILEPEKEVSGRPIDSPPVVIGRSREDRPILGHILGSGPRSLSLIGGCHADEPVGPAMLHKLVLHLSRCARDNPLLADFRWFVIPHLNPDGAERNSRWTGHFLRVLDHLGQEDRAYDPVLYFRYVVRELPGDDIEFGFPRSAEDHRARPENLAAAAFLSTAGPIALHASFHGMGLAPGPWFLLEPTWIDRTQTLRDALRRQVQDMDYSLFDVDRQGEKGFLRIDPGFSTRPDSRAMIAHFEALGDLDTASRFRPSSMEWVQGRGAGPLTLVSEMPLFLLPAEPRAARSVAFTAGSAARRRLHQQLARLATDLAHDEALAEVQRLGIRPMPIRDQMRLQLAFLSRAIETLDSPGVRPPRPRPGR